MGAGSLNTSLLTRQESRAGTATDDFKRRGGVDDEHFTVVPAPAAGATELQEIIAEAVESLYSDELEPISNILLKRVRELCSKKGMPYTDMKERDVREHCLALPGLRVTPASGFEFSVHLEERQPCFEDPHNSADKYPQALWDDLIAYIREASKSHFELPGGRYECASELIRLGIPCLKDQKLGQVCHIVQLAISKRILGYAEHPNTLVIYENSLTQLKGTHADQGKALNRGNTALPVADFEQAVVLLKKILKTKGEVPISNVKRLFESQHKVKLSETALKYEKLSDLLRDPEMKTVCELQPRGRVLFVVPIYELQSATGSTLTPRDDSVSYDPPEAEAGIDSDWSTSSNTSERNCPASPGYSASSESSKTPTTNSSPAVSKPRWADMCEDCDEEEPVCVPNIPEIMNIAAEGKPPQRQAVALKHRAHSEYSGRSAKHQQANYCSRGSRSSNRRQWHSGVSGSGWYTAHWAWACK